MSLKMYKVYKTMYVCISMSLCDSNVAASVIV